MRTLVTRVYAHATLSFDNEIQFVRRLRSD